MFKEKVIKKRKNKLRFGRTEGKKNTSLPRSSFTKEATSAKSKFKATKPLLPRFPNSMSGFTTNFEDKSQGSFSGSSLKSVDSVT